MNILLPLKSNITGRT